MKLNKIIVSKLEENGLLKYDKDIYLYGLNNGLMLFINLITSFIIAIFLHKVLALVIFLMCFIPLRSYCGGVHSHSRIVCYIISNTLILLMLFTFKYIYFYYLPFFIFSLCCFFYLCLSKPKSNNKRNLDSTEIKTFNKLKYYVLIFNLLIFLILFFLKKEYSIIVLFSIILVFFLVIIEKIYLHKQK